MNENIIKLQCTIPKEAVLTEEVKQKLTKFQIESEELLPEGIEIEYIVEK